MIYSIYTLQKFLKTLYFHHIGY